MVRHSDICAQLSLPAILHLNDTLVSAIPEFLKDTKELKLRIAE